MLGEIIASPLPRQPFCKGRAPSSQNSQNISTRGLLALTAGPFWKAVASWAPGERPFCSSSSDLDDKTHPSILMHFLEACRLARALLARNVIEMKGHKVPEHLLGHSKRLPRPPCYQIRFYLLSSPPPFCTRPPRQEREECFSPRTITARQFDPAPPLPTARPEQLISLKDTAEKGSAPAGALTRVSLRQLIKIPRPCP